MLPISDHARVHSRVEADPRSRIKVISCDVTCSRHRCGDTVNCADGPIPSPLTLQTLLILKRELRRGENLPQNRIQDHACPKEHRSHTAGRPPGQPAVQTQMQSRSPLDRVKRHFHQVTNTVSAEKGRSLWASALSELRSHHDHSPVTTVSGSCDRGTSISPGSRMVLPWFSLWMSVSSSSHW